MDYKPRSNYNNKSSLTYKKNRCFWFNSEFNEDFIINNGKIYEIIFKVPPFQIYKNNNMKVITYIRGSQNSRPIIIKMKEPFLSYQTIFNSDNEAYPVIYINHTGVEGMTSITPNYSLIPQQIPRFIFRFDDNFNKLDFTSYFTSITNGSLFQVAGGGNDDKYITFNSSGSFVLDKNLTCDFFMIGGGGAGGHTHGGGGGAGAYYYGTNQFLKAGTYTITVGAGGLKGDGGSTIPANGGNTSISLGGTIIYSVNGGGAGGYSDTSGTSDITTRTGKNGGCGGGGGSYNGGLTPTNTSVPAGSASNTGTNGSGFNGGTGYVDMNAGVLSGGGGGGIGEVGANATTASTGNGAKGGSGLIINITGVPIPYGGGGGGGVWGDSRNPNLDGGLGGGAGGFIIGGKGGKNLSFPATSGVANTGSGGGGGSSSAGIGGDGGSGVVIIRFRETRQEGLTPDETIITSTNNSIIIPVNSKYNINYGDYFNIPKGSYQAVFSDGSITFNSITDKSYPILKDANNNNINPLIWYKFDDMNSNIDSGTLNQTLTNINTVLVNTTNYIKGDGSASFITASNQYFEMPTTVDFNQINTSTGITLSIWFNVISSANDFNLFNIGNFNPITNLGTKWLMLGREGSTNTVACKIYDGSNYKSYVIPSANITINTNAWYNVIWTISTAGVWNIYVNGIINLSNSTQSVIPVFDSTNKRYWIGKNLYTDSDRTFTGYLDDFRIYDRTLTQTQVSELYNGRLSIYNPPEFILGVEIKDA